MRGNVLCPALRRQRVCREVKLVQEQRVLGGNQRGDVQRAKVADAPVDVAAAFGTGPAVLRVGPEGKPGVQVAFTQKIQVWRCYKNISFLVLMLYRSMRLPGDLSYG